MSKGDVAAAVAFTSSDGGTIVVSAGPNGCVVSKNQRHVGRVEVRHSGRAEHAGFIPASAPLPESDVEIVRIAAVHVGRLAEDVGRVVELWADDGEEATR